MSLYLYLNYVQNFLDCHQIIKDIDHMFNVCDHSFLISIGKKITAI